ncbi:MAG: molybdopterin biosynthesis protein [Anaerolineae bacterium]|nr:molybdopterin biosynthesis protein [Anaerolineae bacterium]
MSDNRNIYLEDIPLDEAQTRLLSALESCDKWQSLPGERVSLDGALGRVTAEPIWANVSSPHYHAAAMDGYAVRASDTLHATETHPVSLAVPGQAIPVNTGTPLPNETNAVIMIENTQLIGKDQIEIRTAVAPWQHVRLVGEDMVMTELVLPANHRLRPVDLGAIAGCGHTDVLVRRRPRVAVLPTGSELVSPNESLQPGQVIEYNSIVLGAQIRENGGEFTRWPALPDEPEAIRSAILEASASHDLVLVLSGSSAGSRDFTARAVREAGSLLVHGVAVRPGHPVIIGLVNAVPVIGVPGYPVSAALTGEIFVQPMLYRWLGLPAPRREQIKATLTRKLTSPGGDDDFVRVAVGQVGDRMLATPLTRGAGVITSLARADGLLHIPRFSEGLNAGSEVDVQIYRSRDEIAQTVVAVGSHDPMLDLLSQFLAVRYPGYRLSSANVGSLGGLMAQKRGEAHLSGTHLLDPETGEYNTSYIHRILGHTPVRVVTFVHREQGLIVMPGNPLRITSLDDLERASYINRQRGAGTRVLLDYELGKRGIDPSRVTGYDREEYTHMAVAAAVASGSADCGMGIHSAATALGLVFIPVAHERYDLVIPAQSFDLPMIRHILSLLNDAEFRAAVAAQPGYDVSAMGQEVSL